MTEKSSKKKAGPSMPTSFSSLEMAQALESEYRKGFCDGCEVVLDAIHTGRTRHQLWIWSIAVYFWSKSVEPLRLTDCKHYKSPPPVLPARMVK